MVKENNAAHDDSHIPYLLKLDYIDNNDFIIIMNLPSISSNMDKAFVIKTSSIKKNNKQEKKRKAAL